MSVFIPIPKKGNVKECSNYCIIPLISHTIKIMLKLFNSTWTKDVQMFKLDLEKAEEPAIKMPTSTGSSKKQDSSRKTSTSALLTMLKPFSVWITINFKKFLEMGIPDHLTCLLKNLYASQEATVRTGHGATDWFQIRKGICQDCILSPYLFNLYAEYIMWNASLEEAQFSSATQWCSTVQPHGLQHAMLPSPSPTPRACSNSHPLSQCCHPTISSSVAPFSDCRDKYQ